jgi:uncharacterized membrane protein (DUF106 family)
MNYGIHFCSSLDIVYFIFILSIIFITLFLYIWDFLFPLYVNRKSKGFLFHLNYQFIKSSIATNFLMIIFGYILCSTWNQTSLIRY